MGNYQNKYIYLYVFVYRGIRIERLSTQTYSLLFVIFLTINELSFNNTELMNLTKTFRYSVVYCSDATAGPLYSYSISYIVSPLYVHTGDIVSFYIVSLMDKYLLLEDSQAQL